MLMSGCLDGKDKSSVSPHPDSRIASRGKDGDSTGSQGGWSVPSNLAVELGPKRE